jgi:penicillin-binding protein 2
MPGGDDRTPPMTPQLALRVAIIGSCALVMFAVIFFRLWFLQVLSGNQYTAQAEANISRHVAIAAPRGEILDSNGDVLVDSAPVPSVQIAGPDLPIKITATNIYPTDSSRGTLLDPPAQDQAVYKRLGTVLRMSNKRTPCKFSLTLGAKTTDYHPRLNAVACKVAQSLSQAAYTNVTIKTDVTADIQAYLAERQLRFPGVVTQEVYLRKYPFGTLAAQLFGTVGPLNADEVNPKTGKGKGSYKGIPETDVVGQSGLEAEYNQYLQGVDGRQTIKVNSQGEFEGYGKTKSPAQGENLKLSINAKLQRVGEDSLEHSISITPNADGGAFVAMDPDNGHIYAMGSNPTFNPSIFAKPLSEKRYKKLTDVSSNYPLENRATNDALPDGSTFKVITATAALEGGVITPSTIIDDTGRFCYPNENPATPGACLRNSGGEVNGDIDLVEAIKLSDDVFFYTLGYKLDYNPIATYNFKAGGELQKWARAFGVGQPTGVDLPGESSGTLPSPALVQELDDAEKQCEAATGDYRYTNGTSYSRTPAAGYHRNAKSSACEIASPGGDATWTVGDNVNAAVGQGDVQVTPLQLAVVYSAIANGGKIVTPRLGEDIQSGNGTVIQQIKSKAKRHLDISSGNLDTILEGLRDAASEPGGTSADVMGDFPMPVYGKTGTAQEGTAEQIATNTESDYAWYACFVPRSATSKPIVVVVSVEKGGFGDVAAAPVARQILSQWFYGKPGVYKTGTSTDQ